MKITTVTVCYNVPATIGRTVQSFLAQTHPDKELLVIDGGSTDGTVEAIQSFQSGAIRIISEPDSGIYDAMNKGLALFSGEAVGFLNADDVYHDVLVLTRIAQALESADAVYGDLKMVADQTSKKTVREWQAGAFVPGSFRDGWMPPHPTFYLRRELVEKTGPFDLTYRISADYDFMLRALELHNPRVRHIPHTLVDFTIGGVSTKNPMAVILGNLECLRARRRHVQAPFIDVALFAKPLRKLRQLS